MKKHMRQLLLGTGLVLGALLPLSLLAQANAGPNKLISVFDKDTKLLIGDVPRSATYQLVREENDWQIVQFDAPIVPLWASASFVREEDGMALINSSKLNARSGPSLNSHVISQFPAGYRVRIRERQNGFVRLVAPRKWIFALRKTVDLNTLSTPAAGVPEVVQIDKPAQQLETEVIAVEPEVLISSSQKPSVVPETQAVVPEIQAVVPEIQAVVPEIQAVVPEIQAVSPEAQVVGNSVSRLHRLAPGDTVSLLVFGESDLSVSNVRVPASGFVSFPLIGATQVSGKTTSEIEELVRAALAGGYVRNPKISVTIDSYRPVFIRGAVLDTGSYPFTEGLTVGKALALAGGTRNSAKSKGVSISRDGLTIEQGLSIDSQYEISSGDIISVAEEVGVDDEAAFYIYLHGEVKNPGEYKFRRGLTVEKAVVLAGGFSLRASRKRIAISREVEGQEKPEKLKNVKLYLNVQPGDIIDVGARWF